MARTGDVKQATAQPEAAVRGLTRTCLTPTRVDEKIAAAVAAAPPLPDDVAARLVELIRASQTGSQPTAPPAGPPITPEQREAAVRILARRPATVSPGAERGAA